MKQNNKMKKVLIAGFLSVAVVTSIPTSFLYHQNIITADAASKYISKTKAKSIALKNAGLKASEVEFTKVKLDKDDGVVVYEIEFYKGTREYSYEINAKSGKILKKEIEKEKQERETNSYIGKSKAKQIALKHAGLKASEVDYIKVKLDKDDGVAVYEVEFYNKNKEYSYEINAKTGKIIEWESEYED